MDNAVFISSSLTETRNIGALFGRYVFSSYLQMTSNGGPSFVVCAFGAANSGKSVFLRAAVEVATNSRQPDLMVRFGEKDLGLRTYPNGKIPTHKIRENMEYPCGYPVAPNYGAPAFIDCVEHPTIPHLSNADVTIVFSKPSEVEKNTRYLTEMSENLKAADTAVGKASVVSEELMTLFQATKGLTNLPETDRILSLTLHSQDPAKVGLFRQATESMRTTHPLLFLGNVSTRLG